MKQIVVPAVLEFARAAFAVGVFTIAPVAVNAATVSEIANLKAPDREQVLVEGARKEGKVVIYSAMIEDQALRSITQAFRQKYPFIVPEFWRADTRDLINKALAEARARAVVGDIIEGGGVSQALIKAGILQSFSTPAVAPFTKERFDSKGMWAATRVSYFGLAYNTRLVKVEEAPKTYQDLLDPKWKGKLCWASTTETGGALMFITFIRRALGEEKGETYLRDLSKQNVDNLTGSPREVVNKVMQGECAIALDIFLHHPIISAQKGAPVAARALEPVLSNASVVTLAKGSTHPHAAMLLIDYLLSVDAQKVLEKADYLPAHPDVPPQQSLASIVPRMAHLEEIFLSEEFMFDNRAKSLDLQKKYFGSR
jgi:iron(III) transport system substrate-binding protein